MKVIILAAGYGTRLIKSAKEDSKISEKLKKHIVNNPKPLLKLGEKRIVECILDKIKGIEDINEVIIIFLFSFSLKKYKLTIQIVTNKIMF